MTFRFTVALLAGLFGLVGFANAQVFTQDDGAVTGPTNEGDGQALYGNFGLTSESDPEFKIYRKMTQRDTAEPLSSAMNVDGNAGEAEWINVNQRQGVPEGPNYVLTAPGMFIGQKNHKTDNGWTVSNPDEILYFKPLIDNSDNGITTNDSNNNAFWDTRFGFMEKPGDYINFAEANSGQLDLWTGEFATDAVYLQNHITRDDSASDQVQQRTGHGGSFKVHAEPSAFGDERGRTNIETAKTQAGTGAQLSRTGFVDAGAGYEDPIEVTWGMRLANPDAEVDDPNNFDQIVAARAVEFWVKTGSNIVSGVFDPGGENQDPPDEINNDFEDYSDEFFDWQNSFPVFFAGAQGRAQGTGRMGIFIPGDFGADGTVDKGDFDRLANNYNTAGTTYSRGDYTQDGHTNIDDLNAWGGLASDEAKIASLDAVKADKEAGGDMYDFDGSGATDDTDITMISDLFGIDACTPNIGDFNGDKMVDFSDFLTLSTNFETAQDASGGDTNCDGMVNFQDFLTLSTNFGAVIPGAAVPEPTGLAMVFVGLLSMGALRRRRNG